MLFCVLLHWPEQMVSATTKDLRSVLDLLFDDLDRLGVDLPPKTVKELHSAAHRLSADDLQLITSSGSVSKMCAQEGKYSQFCLAFHAAIKHVAHGRLRTQVKKAVAATLAVFAVLAAHVIGSYGGALNTKINYNTVILPQVEKVLKEGGRNVKLLPEIIGENTIGWKAHKPGFAFKDKRRPGHTGFNTMA